MDIDGVGPALIDQLVTQGLVRTYADLYRLHARRDEVVNLERMGAKSTDKFLTGLERSKAQPLARVLAALNIRHIGTRAAETLAEHFTTMDRLAEAPVDEIETVEEIGPVMAKTLHAFFRSSQGRATIDALAEAGVNMTQPKRDNVGDQPLAGKTIVVTGTLARASRKEVQDLIVRRGGTVAGSVSKKTDFVVAGDKAGSKRDKAETLGVEVIDEDEFFQRAGGA
jgi:DNA ligase (NAD+)